MKKLIILMCILIVPLSSQTRELEIVGGLHTSNILWDNPAKSLIAPQVDEGEEFIRGGSFDVAQTGIELRLDIPYKERFTIPIGLSYSFYSGRELIPLNSLITTYWRHDLDVARLFTGLYYNYFSFRRFPAQLYAGIDLNAYYIYDINFEQEIEYKELTDLNRIYSVETKDPALRFGSSIRTGLKSKFKGYLNLDISFAYTFMNLLGTDDSRGELLTPEKEFETGESTVQELHVNILLRFFL